MKKLMFTITVFTAMFLMIACGNSVNKNDDNKNQDENQNQSSEVCTSGEYECRGNDSYLCSNSGEELSWQLSESCSNGCDSTTGKCKENQGNDNENNNENNNNDSENNNPVDDTDSTSEEDPSDSEIEEPDEENNNPNEQCEAGDRMCRSIDTEHSFICNEYSHTPVVFEKCNEGCDSNSGKCKPWTDSDSNLTWSAKAPKTMLWDDAVLYCQNLDEGGHDDWRMPNIDELRTLVRNCSGVMTGGACKVSEENACLSYVSCFDTNCSCTETSQENDHYLKIDDIGILWSSSEVPEFETVWGLQVNPSIISSCNKAVEYSVRCVRN